MRGGHGLLFSRAVSSYVRWERSGFECRLNARSRAFFSRAVFFFPPAAPWSRRDRLSEPFSRCLAGGPGRVPELGAASDPRAGRQLQGCDRPAVSDGVPRAGLSARSRIFLEPSSNSRRSCSHLAVDSPRRSSRSSSTSRRSPRGCSTRAGSPPAPTSRHCSQR